MSVLNCPRARHEHVHRHEAARARLTRAQGVELHALLAEGLERLIDLRDFLCG